MSDTPARDALLEWAHRAAAGELSGLDWVAPQVRLDGPRFWCHYDEDGRPQFRHAAPGDKLPPVMVEAAAEAQENGVATLMEAMQLLLAPLSWMVTARRLYWTPLSPVPQLLAQLAEAYGLGAELHANDPVRLARLIARLPTWRQRRGELASTLQITSAVERAPAERYRSAATTEDDQLIGEVMACRSADWWRARKGEAGRPRYRIEGGLLRFQPLHDSPYRLLREDILIEWQPGQRLSGNVLRLLPAWTSPRVVARTTDGTR